MTTQLYTHKPAPLLIAGPPAIGKTFLAKTLEQTTASARVILTTNKPIKAYEKQNDDYHFISTQQYLNKQNENGLATSDFYFGYYFGIEKHVIENIQNQGKIPLIEIYTPKIIPLIRLYPHLHAIFLLPENLTVIEEHMRKRGDTTQEQSYLLEESLHEIEQFNDYFRYLYNECYIVTPTNLHEIAHDITKRFMTP